MLKPILFVRLKYLCASRIIKHKVEWIHVLETHTTSSIHAHSSLLAAYLFICLSVSRVYQFRMHHNRASFDDSSNNNILATAPRQFRAQKLGKNRKERVCDRERSRRWKIVIWINASHIRQQQMEPTKIKIKNIIILWHKPQMHFSNLFNLIKLVHVVRAWNIGYMHIVGSNKRDTKYKSNMSNPTPPPSHLSSISWFLFLHLLCAFRVCLLNVKYFNEVVTNTVNLSSFRYSSMIIALFWEMTVTICQWMWLYLMPTNSKLKHFINTHEQIINQPNIQAVYYSM